jgi:DNA-binding NtrC family response regulator
MQSDQWKSKALLLVAEDEFVVALDLEISLEEKGYAVCGIALTAEDAVRLAERSPVDLAVVDVQLAGGSNGLDAVKLMRERFSVPSIVVSGHARSEEAKAAGAVGLMSKPIDIKQLLRLIEYVLGKEDREGATGTAPRGFLLP